MLIGASDTPGGVEWNRVEPVLPSEIEFGEADCDSAGPHMRQQAGVGEIDLEKDENHKRSQRL